MERVTDPQLLLQLNAPDTQGLIPATPEETEILNRAVASEQAFESLTPFQQFGVGVAKPFVEMGMGIKDLFGGELTPENRAELQRLNAVTGVPATAGEIAGDVAALAVPGAGLGSMAVKGLARLGGGTVLKRSLAAAAGDALATGAAEGIKAPAQGETRFDNALDAAAWTFGTGAGLGVLGKMFGGSVTDAAKALADRGVRLTPGMQGGKVWSWLEGRLSEIPVVGGKTRALQDRALRDWNRELLKDASPYGTTHRITKSGREGFEQVQNQFSNAYNDLWSRVRPDTVDDATPALFAMQRKMRDLPANSQPLAQALGRRVLRDLDTFQRTGNAGLIETLDDVLRESAQDAPDMLTEGWIRGLRGSLRGLLPAPQAKSLAALDSQYARFGTLMEAGRYLKALESESIMGPRQLQSAIKKRTPAYNAVTGRGLMQGQADEGVATLGAVMPERSQIALGRDLANVGTIVAGIQAPVTTAAALTAGSAMVNAPMSGAITRLRRAANDPERYMGGPLRRALQAARIAAGTQAAGGGER